MNRVFIPIVPVRWDPIKEVSKPLHDLSPARAFGDAIVLLPEERGADCATSFDIQPLINEIVSGLECSEADDYIVAVGDPVLIAAAACAQIARHGRVRLLRWDRQDQRYAIKEFRL